MASYDLAGQINTTATNPSEAEADGLRVRAQPLKDQIAADRYLAAKAARAQKLRGLMFTKLLPAGPSPDQQQTNVGPASGPFDALGY